MGRFLRNFESNEVRTFLTSRREGESWGRVGSTDSRRESLKQAQEAGEGQEKNETDALGSGRLRDLCQSNHTARQRNPIT